MEQLLDIRNEIEQGIFDYLTHQASKSASFDEIVQRMQNPSAYEVVHIVHALRALMKDGRVEIFRVPQSGNHFRIPR